MQWRQEGEPKTRWLLFVSCLLRVVCCLLLWFLICLPFGCCCLSFVCRLVVVVCCWFLGLSLNTCHLLPFVVDGDCYCGCSCSCRLLWVVVCCCWLLFVVVCWLLFVVVGSWLLSSFGCRFCCDVFFLGFGGAICCSSLICVALRWFSKMSPRTFAYSIRLLE